MKDGGYWHARYTVLSVLVIVNIVSFMDRMVMSVAIPYIGVDFHLTPVAMGAVMSAFFVSYSISQIPGGILADKFGVRRVASLAMLWWSVFTAITGAAANVTQMLIARVCFGFGEGVYPACAFKTVAMWFPKKERARTTGMLLASSMLGAALAPLFVVQIIAAWGWRPVFFSLFLPGIMTAALFWFFVPAKPQRGHATPFGNTIEPTVVNLDDPAGIDKPSELRIFRDLNLWKCFLILFVYDLAYWGFTTWLPTYLVKARGFSLAEMGVAASLPSFSGAIGCIMGGWITDRYFSNNRRLPIVIAQLLSAALLYLTFTAETMKLLIIYQTLAGLFLAFFFSTFWALPMNAVSKKVMGAASGFINMAGQCAAFIAPVLIGFLVQASRGKFASTFAFLIIAVLISCALVFTLPKQMPEETGLPDRKF